MRQRRVSYCVVLALAALALGPAAAQTPNPALPFTIVVAEWTRTLDGIDRYIGGNEKTAERTKKSREDARRIAADANAAKAQAEQDIAAVQRLVDALGPVPEEGDAPEPEAVVTKRKKYGEEIALLRSRVSLANLAATRAAKLEAQLSVQARTSLLTELSTQLPTPLAPSQIAIAVPEFFADLGTLARSWRVWHDSLTEEEKRAFEEREDRYPMVALIAAILALAVRYALLKWCGRHAAVESPSYARRLAAAVAEGVARGIIPALIFAGLLYQINRPGALISGQFYDVVNALLISLILFTVVTGVTRAALAPDRPAWRLTNLTPQGAKSISRWVLFVGGVFAFDLFLQNASANLDPSEALISFYALVTDTLEAVGILALARLKLWRVEAEAAPEGGDGPTETLPPGRFWTIIRLLITLAAATGIVAAATGFTYLSWFLIKNLLISGLTIAGLYLLRGLLREVIGALVRGAWIRDDLGLSPSGRQRLKFWLRAVIDPLLFVAALYFLMPMWGVPVEDMSAWTASVLQGFTIGDITISVVDIVLAVLVFAGVLIGARLIQRALNDKVLPQTNLHPSVQTSVSASVGYIGLVLAVALGLGTLGFGLTNLALIAGALSVGIGFGLQNIVNNFVSGLILLIERPIKVGDWVVVGTNEGFVKRINVRATELETFQRASVIIPNSDMLSNAVTNWTYKDKFGRIEVRVGVAYGSDTDQVREILLSCANTHPEISKWPEPFVLFMDFGGSALEFELRAFIPDIENVYIVASDLRFAIDQAFREAGIEIPFLQTDIHLRDIDRLEKAFGGGRPALREMPGDDPDLRRAAQGGKD